MLQLTPGFPFLQWLPPLTVVKPAPLTAPLVVAGTIHAATATKTVVSAVNTFRCVLLFFGINSPSSSRGAVTSRRRNLAERACMISTDPRHLPQGRTSLVFATRP